MSNNVWCMDISNEKSEKIEENVFAGAKFSLLTNKTGAFFSLLLTYFLLLNISIKKLYFLD